MFGPRSAVQRVPRHKGPGSGWRMWGLTAEQRGTAGEQRETTGWVCEPVEKLKFHLSSDHTMASPMVPARAPSRHTDVWLNTDVVVINQ